MTATCFLHLIVLYVVILIICFERYKLYASLCIIFLLYCYVL
jgi:hypothetical protein